MPIPVFPQSKEADLLAWSSAFSALITASPTSYGLTAAQATAYATLHSTFASAYAIAIDPNSNSKANVQGKNAAKEALLYGPGGAWQLVNVCQAWPSMNDSRRTQLNIRVPDTDPTPVPVPSESPVIDVVSTFGTTIRVKVHQASEGPTTPSGKPEGVKGASVCWFAGENPPADPVLFHFGANTTKNVVDVQLPATTTPGAKVWLTAFWFNNKMQSGPGATPVSIHIPGTMSMAA